MVFENRVFRWIWEIVAITILQLQEFVNLSCCELVGVATVDLSQHSVTRLNVARRSVLSQQLARNHLLDHGHRAGSSRQFRKSDLPRLEILGEGEDAPALDYQPSH